MPRKEKSNYAEAPAVRTCTFSPDRIYRYKLTIQWKHEHFRQGRFVNFIMLNPSTADEMANDPTVERCERRARAWGYDGVIITNLFAFRATDPGELPKVADAIGPDNDDSIVEMASAAQDVICAWGTQPRIKELMESRGKFVRMILAAERITPYYLRLSKEGIPCHPLYLPYTEFPKMWLKETTHA